MALPADRRRSAARAAPASRRGVASSRRGPRRVVVDQVCLVPDVPSFFEAIAAWDEGHFFPILIDEPAWTLPFLRAFRPARVVRYAAAGDRRASPAVAAWTGGCPRSAAVVARPGRRRPGRTTSFPRAVPRRGDWVRPRRAWSSARPTARCSPAPWPWPPAGSSPWSASSRTPGDSTTRRRGAPGDTATS